MKHPNPDMLVYIAIADAYAAAAEYLKFPRDNHVKKEILKFDGYKMHPTHRGKPGTYTDDTEMSVANVHVLLRDEPSTKLMYADSYVREFARGGQRKGYSNNFQHFLERVKTGEQFLAEIKPDSNKNGAAMRAVPFGVLNQPLLVLLLASDQASLTHDTPEGLFSARAVALMAHFALHSDEPLRCMGEYCLAKLPVSDIKEFGSVFQKRWGGGPVNSSHAPVSITTVHAVADLVMHQTSLMGILKTAIEWGGDTDSVVAIAWGITSARYQDEQLPDFMRRDLEQGSEHTGVAYLADLGAKLMKKYS